MYIYFIKLYEIHFNDLDIRFKQLEDEAGIIEILGIRHIANM